MNCTEFIDDPRVVHRQRRDDAHDGTEHCRLCEFLERHPIRHDDRYDDVTVFLSLWSRRPACCLDHFGGTLLRVGEDHAVDGGHVDAFLKTSGVGHEGARGLLELVEQ